ncbi:hypothetical protein V502_06555 [Pseudogymnoascus sp. VKM F-4520 (FW-2644)]|nr:hypothetical protein V502_06555 [Pseudogymnoascus sp. VKM F-4520 (FW-2644)]
MATKPTWFRPLPVFSAAIILRIGLFLYGLWQDANSPMKYTDIDYYVFTDAARYVATNHSPYDRETYRYTPILSWLLLPTTWQGKWFSFGKGLFALSDIITGWLIVLVLRTTGGMPMDRALKFASIWLLNPMVATISTRGSSEGLLATMVVALVWAHFILKLHGIHPVIYASRVFGIHSAAISLCNCASAFVGEEGPTVDNVGTNLFVRDLQQSLYEPVLPLVHGVPPVLSTHVIFGCIPAGWHNGACPVGFNASYVAPTGL